MYSVKGALTAIVFSFSSAAFAGGLLTNTNQSITFLRNPARDAAIGIDGVYSNPAGVAFLRDGLHLSINIQNAHQTRSVETRFAPFAFGVQNSSELKRFEGTADAPILPSLQLAYNKGQWGFQFGFAVTGGGGKCVFEDGLPSFESTVAMLPLLSKNMDALTTQLGMGTLGLPTVDQYNMETFMRGRQYYFGFTFGSTFKANEHWSFYGGLRLLYGNANYYGYVKNIQAVTGGQTLLASEAFKGLSSQALEAVGQYTQAAQMYQEAGDLAQAQAAAQAAKDYTVKAIMLNALGTATEDVTLNCDQVGWGVAPILGVDYKTGAFNFALKYEFKTRMRLKNKSANSQSASNLPMLAKFKDGQTVEEDSPSLLTLGAQWSVIPQLRLNAGYHHYFDKDAHLYNHHEKLLGGDTNEYLFGAEYDISKAVEVSAGMQSTRYQMTDRYMEDVSFNVSSYSFGFGVGVHVTDKVKLNAAYFQTNYTHYNRESQDYNNLSATAGQIVGGVATALQGEEAAQQAVAIVNTALTTPNPATGKSLLYGTDSFTRTNRVLGIGVEIDF